VLHKKPSAGPWTCYGHSDMLRLDWRPIQNASRIESTSAFPSCVRPSGLHSSSCVCLSGLRGPPLPALHLPVARPMPPVMPVYRSIV
jgi:hypothetical protein